MFVAVDGGIKRIQCAHTFVRELPARRRGFLQTVRQRLEGGHVLYSEPRKMVFTGLVVGAVAIGVGAYVSHSDEEWLPSDDLGVTHGGGPDAEGHGNMTSGVVRSAPRDAHGDSAAARAASLKAARNSLLRDDVAAARAQLNAIGPAHRDDQQVLALQRDIQTRADQDQRAAASAASDAQAEKTPRLTQEAVRTPSSSPAIKAMHSRDTQLASREYSNRAAGYTRGRRKAEAVTGANKAGAGAVPGATTRVAMNSVPLLQQPATASGQQAMDAVQSVQPAQAAQPVQPVQPIQQTLPPELTAEAGTPTTSVAQPPVPTAPLLKTDGPKTRAQVREEIVRAREDGHLPAFGNPDPAGPGGAPSLTIVPRP
jgi:hypothetical protein